MRNKWLLILAFTLVLTSITGCAVYRRPTPNTPSVPNPATPNNQVQPTVADQIIQQVNAMPQVKGSYAVVLGNVAMVGIDLRDRLSGEQENALKTRISTEVKQKMPALAEVWVSADPDLVVRIRDLAARIGRGEPVSGFMDQITALFKKLQPKSS